MFLRKEDGGQGTDRPLDVRSYSLTWPSLAKAVARILLAIRLLARVCSHRSLYVILDFNKMVVATGIEPVTPTMSR